jgi:hypothetical protein
VAGSTGPKIPTTGLTFAIDAGNTRCTDNGTADTVNNLITGGVVTGTGGSPGTGTHTPVPANFPELSGSYGGHFDFTDGRGMRVEELLSKGTTMSQCMWFYCNNSAIQYFGDGRSDAGTYFLSNYNSSNININDQLKYKFSDTYATDDSAFLNQWHCLTVTSDSAGSKLYLGGTEVSSYITQGSVDEDFGKNYTVGSRHTSGSPWHGKMGLIHFYDRVLSAVEAKQYYNSTKTRYI